MENKEQNNYEIASELFLEGEFDKALEIYENILKNDPNDLSALQNIAISYKHMGNHDRAFEIYDKIFSINPNHSASLNNCGNLYMQIGNYKRAIEYYEKALEIDPNAKNTYANLGSLYQRQEDFEKALNCFNKQNDPKYDQSIAECMLAQRMEKELHLFLSNYMTSSEKINIGVSSLSAYATNQFGWREDPYPFCSNPFKLVFKKNTQLDNLFNKEEIKKLLNFLKTQSEKDRLQDLVVKGKQSAGNIFRHKNNELIKVKKLITDHLKGYYLFLKDSEQSIYTESWPMEAWLYAWTVVINESGFLKRHNHTNGWVSGVLYLKLPQKQNNEGNIQFSLHGNNYKKINEDLIPYMNVDIEEGDIILFPSSIFHGTIPFKEKTDRICLAFDLRP